MHTLRVLLATAIKRGEKGKRRNKKKKKKKKNYTNQLRQVTLLHVQ